MNIVIGLLIIGCPLAAILFLVRLLCAPFSNRVSEEMRRHPIIHSIWACFAVLGFLVMMGVLNPAAWPPTFVERHTQRKKVVERVQAAGGWEKLKRDCILLTQTNDWVNWYHRSTNNSVPLPPSLAALQPQQVHFVTPRLLGENSEEERIPIVRIKVFGMHSTGGHSTPYFGLEVVTGPSSQGYTPKPRPAAAGNGHLYYQKVADGIYERF